MDRFDVIKFEDLTGPQGGEWVKIGGGSFGVVFRGEYLGTEVAIKEVLPNNTYDVEKYFERECVLMKEARHPNIVQYIGLTKSPGLNGRIYIISEFVGGNLRSYIADKRKSFDWPLRVSFATDIARAVAYLHARNCLHRDLKGENLLITANDRIKVCDFGFARIAARNEEEMRRISYCGTDGYMSPEILMGVDFSLPSDVFSLGIIFCEIISRHLVDANTFKRMMPSFGLEEDEVREMASSGCPTDFIQLSLDCCKVEPQDRPGMREVIKRLRLIENEIVQREFKKGTLSNIGSLRGSSLHALTGGSKNGHRKGARPRPPRLPSFDGQVKMVRAEEAIKEESPERSTSEESSDDDMEEALEALEKVNLGLTGNGEKASKMALDSIKVASTFKVAGHGNPWWDDDSDDSSIAIPQSWIKMRPEPDSPKTPDSEEMATSASYKSKVDLTPSLLASKLSAMDTDDVDGSNLTIRRRAPLGDAEMSLNRRSHLEGITHTHKAELSDAVTLQPSRVVMHTRDDSGGEVTQSFMTAHSSHHHHHHSHPRNHDPSLAMATIASSIYEPALLFHRFTLVKSGMKRSNSIHQTMEDPSSSSSSSPQSNAWTGSLMPPQLILANALTKCNVCNKRLGFGAYMDCDDCPYKTHVGCAAMAEPNCQELQLPHSNGGSPAVVVAPLIASRRGSLAAPAAATTAAATALNRITGGNASSPSAAAHSHSSSSSHKKDRDAKSPPSSLSRGVNYFRKRNSKSPPPQKSTLAPAPIRA